MPWRAQFLGERLGAFEAGGGGAWAERRNAGRLQLVDQADAGGSSGPGTTSSTPFSRQKATMPGRRRAQAAHRSPRARSHRCRARSTTDRPGAMRQRQRSPCSRPPAPTTRTFMPTPDVIALSGVVAGCRARTTALPVARIGHGVATAFLASGPTWRTSGARAHKSAGAPWQLSLRSGQGVGTNKSLPVAVLPHQRYASSGPWARIAARDGRISEGPDRIGRYGHGHVRAARPAGDR